MTINVSTNFKQRLLGPESFPAIFNGGRILIYSGAQPATADHPVTGTYLGQVTEQGQAWGPGSSAGGLNFVLAGVWAAHDPAQTWRLIPSVGGTAGWFRLVGRLADDSGHTFSAPRIDGSIGTGGTVDMKIPSVSLTAGFAVPIQQFLFSFPPFTA